MTRQQDPADDLWKLTVMASSDMLTGFSMDQMPIAIVERDLWEDLGIYDTLVAYPGFCFWNFQNKSGSRSEVHSVLPNPITLSLDCQYTFHIFVNWSQ